MSTVVITDANGTVLEQGNASTNGSRRLRITAHDRPGHTAQTSWQN